MSAGMTPSWFAVIVAATREESLEEVEPMIDDLKFEAALKAAFGGPEEIVLYPEPVGQAAVFCAELIRLRPLDRDNKKVAFNCMLELLVRHEWRRLEASREQVAEQLDGVSDGSIRVADFVRWVRARVGRGEWLRYVEG